MIFRSIMHAPHTPPAAQTADLARTELRTQTQDNATDYFFATLNSTGVDIVRPAFDRFMCANKPRTASMTCVSLASVPDLRHNSRTSDLVTMVTRGDRWAVHAYKHTILHSGPAQHVTTTSNDVGTAATTVAK